MSHIRKVNVNVNANNCVLLKHHPVLNLIESVTQQSDELMYYFLLNNDNFLVYWTIMHNFANYSKNIGDLDEEDYIDFIRIPTIRMHLYLSDAFKRNQERALNACYVFCILEEHFPEYLQFIHDMRIHRKRMYFQDRKDFSLTIDFGQAQPQNSVTLNLFKSLMKKNIQLIGLTLNMNNSDLPIYDFLNRLSQYWHMLPELTITAEADNYIQENIVGLISERFHYLSRLRYLVPTNVFGFGQLRQIPCLTHLELYSNPYSFNDHDLTELLSGCHYLQSLNMRHDVGDNLEPNLFFTIDSIPEHCSYLLELQFCVINGLIDDVMEYQIRTLTQLKRLQVLVLKSFKNITQQTVEYIIRNIPYIERLVLLDCPLVSTNGFITAITNAV